MAVTDFSTDWLVSSEDDSESSKRSSEEGQDADADDDDDDDDDDGDDVSATLSQTRKGGRSLGQNGPQFRAKRERLLQAAGIEVPLPLAEFQSQTQPESTAGVQAHPVDPMHFLRPLGTAAHRRLREAILAPPRFQDGDDEWEDIDRTLGHLLRNRTAATTVAEAKLVGMARRTYARRVQEIAAIAHFGSRLFVSSLLSKLLLEVHSGKWQINACVCQASYDETPLPMRGWPPLEKRLGVDTDELGDDDSAAALAFEVLKERGTMKLVQTQFTLSIVAQEVGESIERQKLLTFSVPYPLEVVDRATGRTLRANLQEQTFLHYLPEIRSVAAMVQDVTTTDGAPANAACDESAYADGDEAFRFRVLCATHGLSNAQGYVFSTSGMPECLTGVISMSLVQRAGGALQMLRKAVATVLQRSVHVHVGCLPPQQGDARQRYKQTVLDLFLPATNAKFLERRSALDLMLQGDLQSDVVDVYVESEAARPDVAAWSRLLASLLLPSRIEVFPR